MGSSQGKKKVLKVRIHQSTCVDFSALDLPNASNDFVQVKNKCHQKTQSSTNAALFHQLPRSEEYQLVKLEQSKNNQCPNSSSSRGDSLSSESDNRQKRVKFYPSTSKNSHSKSINFKPQRDYSKQMRNKWFAQVQPLLPSDDLRVLKEPASSDQFSPEFSQAAYETMLKQERSQSKSNVFKSGIQRLRHTITLEEREKAVRRLVQLVNFKNYREETLHLAIAILDKAIEKNYPDLDNMQLQLVMLTSLFLAAKMEQPKNPSGRLLMEALTDEESCFISLDELLQTERVLLEQFDYQFNIVTSLQFIERFIQLAGITEEPELEDMAYKIMLTYKAKTVSHETKPSHLAAGCLYFAVVKCWNGDRKRITSFLRNWDNNFSGITQVDLNEMKEAFKLVRKTVNEGERQTKRKNTKVRRFQELNQQCE